MTLVELIIERRGHSCVLIRSDSSVLVVDPGIFSDVKGALEIADAVLVTHEHADHIDIGAVVASDLPTWGPEPVLELLRQAGARVDLLHSVKKGDRISPVGILVDVLGEWHEVIHPDVPRVVNVGYLIGGSILHPGDAFVEVPDEVQVKMCLVPISGPWLRIADAIDWVRQISPDRVVLIHDSLLSPPGVTLATQWIERMCETQILNPGLAEPVTV